MSLAMSSQISKVHHLLTLILNLIASKSKTYPRETVKDSPNWKTLGSSWIAMGHKEIMFEQDQFFNQIYFLFSIRNTYI